MSYTKEDLMNDFEEKLREKNQDMSLKNFRATLLIAKSVIDDSLEFLAKRHKRPEEVIIQLIKDKHDVVLAEWEIILKHCIAGNGNKIKGALKKSRADMVTGAVNSDIQGKVSFPVYFSQEDADAASD